MTSNAGKFSIARNTFYNFLGQGLPLLVAVLAIPPLIKSLGIERFGILSLAWIIVGYFSLFDLGLGRATTKFVAEYEARGEHRAIPQLVWTSIITLLLFGVIGGLILAALTPLLVLKGLKIAANLQGEAMQTFILLAFSLPFILCTAGVRGVLEAQQRFGVVNAVKVPASIFSYLGPLVMVMFTTHLFYVTLVLVVSRLVVLCLYAYYCGVFIPALRIPQWPRMSFFRKLLDFGGWLTVSSIIGPLMTYMDRFVVGATLGMSAVAYYSTPYDMVTRLWMIPGSLLGVLFPMFSAYAALKSHDFGLLCGEAFTYITLALAPFVIVLVVFAEPILSVWLGGEFVRQSTLVLQILSIGVLINSLAMIPYAALQAAGAPDITAKIHLAELPFYFGLMWLLIPHLGIVGVAVAWLVRIVADTALMFFMARRVVRIEARLTQYSSVVLVIFPMLLVAAMAFMAFASKSLLISVGVAFSLIAAIVWYCVPFLPDEHKKMIAAYFRKQAC